VRSQPQVTTNSRIRLVAFDLDGTLLRGDTVCEVLAKPLGRLERMRELERDTSPFDTDAVSASREEMALWYSETTLDELTSLLVDATLASGAREGIDLLKQHEVKTAIASLTWEFAVEWFAKSMGIDYYAGPRLLPNGLISHFWADDKPIWLGSIAERLGFGLDAVAAVGDSAGDIPMLQSVGYPFFVGDTKPEELKRADHMPGSSIDAVARRIVEVSVHGSDKDRIT